MLERLLMLAVNGAAEFAVLSESVHRYRHAIQIATAFLGVFWPDYILE